MPRKHNVILHDRISLGATATVVEKDLPINPISFITITLRLLNNGANAIPTIATILSKISLVEVLLEGKSLVSGSLMDLAALSFYTWGIRAFPLPITKTDNNIINLSVHIPFGRRPWDPAECLPATRKGDLSLRMTCIADPGGVDTYTATVEVRQVLDMDPLRFLKYTTSPKTPTAAGEHEMDLVVGPDYSGVLFFATTVPTGASQNCSIAKLRLKVDDLETMYPETRWESLYTDGQLSTGGVPLLDEHVHISDLAAAYTQYQSSGGVELAAATFRNYAFVDFDPLTDAEAQYRLITRGRSRVHFLITADVADLVRMLPVELIPLTATPTPGG